MGEGQQKGHDLGLLILRLGIGAVFLGHGVPKLVAGPELWGKLGAALGLFGITSYPVFWGLMCAIAEGVGGAFLVLGLLVRPVAFVMLVNMVVACRLVLSMSKDFGTGVSHPLSLAIVFLAILIAGGGRFGLGDTIGSLKDKWYQ